MNRTPKTRTEVDRTIAEIGGVSKTYAMMLEWLVATSLALMIVTFALYATSVLPSAIGISRVPDLWHLNARDYAEATGRALGWSWLASLAEGRYLVYLSLVVFPAGTMLLVAIASPLYLRRRAPIMAALALAEAGVLLFASLSV